MYKVSYDRLRDLNTNEKILFLVVYSEIRIRYKVILELHEKLGIKAPSIRRILKGLIEVKYLDKTGGRKDLSYFSTIDGKVGYDDERFLSYDVEDLLIPDLSPTSKLVYIYLKQFSRRSKIIKKVINGKEYFRCSNDFIMYDMGMSNKSVIKGFKELEKKGYIKIKRLKEYNDKEDYVYKARWIKKL